MSHSPTSSEPNHSEEGAGAGNDYVAPTSSDESNVSLTETVKELLDVLVATDVLLETIDLDRSSDIVDVEELPTLVNLDRLSAAISERNPDLAFDLSHLEWIIDRRELWNSIDLLAFANAKRTLDRELGDVLGEDTSIGIPADSKAVSDAKEFVSTLHEEAKQALVQQEATEKLADVRDEVVEGHAAFERLYESNRIRFENARERSITGNPTAVSLLPSGPLPDSVSTRLSTVPAEVPNAKIGALPRIYGRRWRRGASKRTRKRSVASGEEGQ